MKAIFGGTGFIGGRYHKLFPGYLVPRNQRNCEVGSVRPGEVKDIVYFISTINNYNVFSNLTKDVETNLLVLMRTLEKWQETQSQATFNFISSWFVYGDHKNQVCHETHDCRPTGFYSITKRCAEQLLISFCETFGLKYRILRLCNVIGESDKSFSKQKNALQWMVYRLANDEKIEIYENGEKTWRDFLYVDDVCEAIELCVRESETNQIINIGSSKSRQMKDLINYCRDKLNSESEIVSIETPDFHKLVQAHMIFLSTSKLKNLGFKPKYTIWDALDKIMEGMK